MRRVAQAVTALLLIAAATTAVDAAQRVYVASTGVDSAPCTLAQPCRSFAAAHASVDAGGEIVALDAAGYGALTITKSVTITANPGVFAGIAAATGSAITIDAPGSSVALRGLQINGTGASQGVLAMNAARLEIEDCVISNFISSGASTSAPGMSLIVSNTTAKGNGIQGIAVFGGGTLAVVDSRFHGNGTGLLVNATRASISDSLFVGNGVGIFADLGAVASITRVVASHSASVGIAALGGSVVVSESQATHNGTYGFLEAAGSFASRGNNQVIGNGTAPTSGTISSAPSF